MGIKIFLGKRWKLLLIGLAVVLTCLIVIPLAAYRESPRLLTIDSGPCSAGAIIVLGGDSIWRPARAAELYAAGEAPLVIVSGNGDWSAADLMLKAGGVPATAIVVEDKSGSTKENADFSVALLRRAGLSNAIIVTSWYHSRRALNCFRRAAPEMQFYSRPSYAGLNRAEWCRNSVGVHIRAEYFKSFGYWLRYGVWPF